MDLIFILRLVTQIGSACWELYCLEHGINPDGFLEHSSSERNIEHQLCSLFKEADSKNPYVEQKPMSKHPYVDHIQCFTLPYMDHGQCQSTPTWVMYIVKITLRGLWTLSKQPYWAMAMSNATTFIIDSVYTPLR